MLRSNDPVRGFAATGFLALVGALGVQIVGPLRQDLGHVRSVAAVLGDDLVPGLRIHAQTSSLLRRGEKAFGQFDGQLVGRQIVAEVGPLRGGQTVVTGDHALQVRTVLADPHIDRAALLVSKQLDGVDLPGVDLLQVDTHQLLQATGPRDRPLDTVLAAEVEVVEPVGALLQATGNRVEFVLHRSGEVVVDQSPEVLLQQADNSERDPRRHQRAALLVDVPAILDCLDDRRIRRRPADSQIPPAP